MNYEEMDMTYKIIYNLTAQKELLDIQYYITVILKEPKIANKLIQKILKSIEILQLYPQLFQKIGKLKQIRRAVVKNYNILYSFDKIRKKVFILHFNHNSKNIK